MKAFKTITVGYTDDNGLYHWATFYFNGKKLAGCFAISKTGIETWERREEYKKMCDQAVKLA